VNVDICLGSSSAARWLPTPMAILHSWAASASILLISPASSVPPVMEEIRIGAASFLPNKLKDVSTASNPVQEVLHE